MPVLFGTSGIRGSVLTKVNAELAVKFGLALATYLGGRGDVVVGYDVRTSSPMLENAVVSGLLAGGCNAIRIGLVPTPVMAFTTRELRAGAGVMVTGSHNPPTDNGLKCYDGQGMEYTPVEEEVLEKLILNDSYKMVPWNSLGEVRAVSDATDRYMAAALQTLTPVSKRLTIIVDCSNGAGALVTPQLLSKIGGRVITLNAQLDGNFPGRPSEPMPQNLEGLARAVKELRADVGIAHDGDADRLAVIDEGGRYVANDRVLSLFGKCLVESHKGGLVITSTDTSFCIDAAVEKVGGKVERTKVGKIHVALREKKAVMAGEPWKIINLDWGPWADGCFSACLLVEMLAKHGGTVAELFSDIPNYPQRREYIDCPDALKDEVMLQTQNVLSKERNVSSVWTFDGIRVNYEDGSWLLVRASGTQPRVCVHAEGITARRLAELWNKGAKLVKGIIKAGQK